MMVMMLKMMTMMTMLMMMMMMMMNPGVSIRPPLPAHLLNWPGSASLPHGSGDDVEEVDDDGDDDDDSGW